MLRLRLAKGWSVKRAFETPVDKSARPGEGGPCEEERATQEEGESPRVQWRAQDCLGVGATPGRPQGHDISSVAEGAYCRAGAGARADKVRLPLALPEDHLQGRDADYSGMGGPISLCLCSAKEAASLSCVETSMSAIDLVMRADVVQDYLAIGDFKAQDEPVRIGQADGMLPGKFAG